MNRNTSLWLTALLFAAGCATQEAPAPAPAPAPTPAPAPAPAPTAKPEAPKPKPVAEKVTFAAGVLFDFDKAVIKPEGKVKLDDLAGKIGGINLEVVIAIGHADMIGPAAYNQKLSERRAEAIKAYFVSKGIEGNRVYTEGKGEAQPVTGGKCKSTKGAALIKCLQPDRRTEIEVIGTRRN